MIYILNGVMKYNSDSGEIFRLDYNEEVAKLTTILNHIFIILIENNRIVTSREELLKKIFDSHNLNVSINTLNQYLSVLRKLLHQQLGIENAILNISKKGIILSSEVIISVNDEWKDAGNIINKNNNVTTEDSKPITLQLRNVEEKNPLIKKTEGKFYTLLLKIIILILFFISIYLMVVLDKSGSLYKPINAFKISDIGRCPVYSFQNATSEVISSIIDDHVKEFGLTCDNSDTFYYYNNNLSSGLNKQSLLVKCEGKKTCISTRMNWRGNYEK